MNIDIRHAQQGTIIAVSGSIDALTADTLHEQMSAQVAEGHTHLVLDLSDVSYASSAGLRSILLVLKESRQLGGDLRVAGLQKGVQRVFEMSGFANILQIHDTVDAALQTYAQER